VHYGSNDGDVAAGVKSVETVWNRVMPQYPFDYSFLDEDFDGMYRSESRMGTLLMYFSVVAIAIACLGLFGLASFSAEQRTREMGVRKVLGASAPQITGIMCREFFVLVILASLVACPIAYVVMSDWLRDFAYRADMDYQIFLAAGVMALVVALLTVSYHAIRMAVSNPVDSLRHE